MNIYKTGKQTGNTVTFQRETTIANKLNFNINVICLMMYLICHAL